MSLYLLDTNMLLGFTRKADGHTRAYEAYSLGDTETMVSTSVICQGEILALAEKNGWGENKRTELDKVLKYQLLINKQSILVAYALIDAWTHGKSCGISSGYTTPQTSCDYETK